MYMSLSIELCHILVVKQILVDRVCGSWELKSFCAQHILLQYTKKKKNEQKKIKKKKKYQNNKVKRSNREILKKTDFLQDFSSFFFKKKKKEESWPKLNSKRHFHPLRQIERLKWKIFALLNFQFSSSGWLVGIFLMPLCFFSLLCFVFLSFLLFLEKKTDKRRRAWGPEFRVGLHSETVA